MEWQDRCKQILILMLILLGGDLSAQQNLVPNPSFEEFDGCPFGAGQIEEATGWFNIIGGCDYFHECGANGFGIPINTGGGGFARTGQAYGQLTPYTPLIENFRESLGIELTEPLSPEIDYRVRFFLTLQDSLNYAVRNVGAHFSVQPHSENLNDLLALEPQVSYSDTAFLGDKSRWMLVEGTFTASGGERYLAIGNFDNDANTDTLFVPDGGNPNGNPPGYWDAAGYFIDDVSVIPDSIYLSNNDIEREEVSVEFYPNPNSGAFNVRLDFDEESLAELQMFSINGQLVERTTLMSGNNVLNFDLTNGLYLYSVIVDRQLKWRGKVSVISD